MSINTIEDAKRAYKNDNTFHSMVDVLVSIIHELNLSPDEVRKAAMFAVFMSERLHIDKKIGKPTCDYAESDMTPCYIKDGEIALSVDGYCVGCNRHKSDISIF